MHASFSDPDIIVYKLTLLLTKLCGHIYKNKLSYKYSCCCCRLSFCLITMAEVSILFQVKEPDCCLTLSHIQQIYSRLHWKCLVKNMETHYKRNQTGFMTFKFACPIWFRTIIVLRIQHFNCDTSNPLIHYNSVFGMINNFKQYIPASLPDSIFPLGYLTPSHIQHIYSRLHWKRLVKNMETHYKRTQTGWMTFKFARPG